MFRRSCQARLRTESWKVVNELANHIRHSILPYLQLRIPNSDIVTDYPLVLAKALNKVFVNVGKGQFELLRFDLKSCDCFKSLFKEIP